LHPNLLLAGAVLAIHLAVINFNLFGLVAVPIGAKLGWRFVRVRWWRILHIGSMAVVAVQAIAGRACFLTILQEGLAGGGAQPPPLIMAFVNRLVFWPLPLWVFTVIYVLACLYTLALWRLVPPDIPTPRPEQSALFRRRP
jgi:hypothetical protein